MDRSSSTLRLLALLLVPPAAATLAAAAVWTAGGKARCFASLQVDDPPLICAAGVELGVRAATIVGFHLLVALPLALWIASRERSGRAVLRLRRGVLLAAMPALAMASLLMSRGSSALTTSTVIDALGGFALPTLLALALALELAGSTIGRRQAA